MDMKKLLLITIAMAFMLTVAVTGHAQMASTNYRIPTSVISSGGAPMSSSSFQTNATLGQSSPLMDASNPSHSASYDNYPGFWYTVDATPPINDCSGDFNNDGDVDGSDLATFAEDFGRTDCAGDCKGDFDTDGDCDGTDLSVFAKDFGRTDCH
jgi:hypothetical protein